MKTSFLAVLICLFADEHPAAQTLRYSKTHPYISLSAYSRSQHDALSFTGNQAALAQVKQWGAGVFGERRFMLAENAVYTAGACFPGRLGNFGIELNYAGFKDFNENRIGIAYARPLCSTVDIGVQFNYYSYNVPAYGKASALNFEIGALVHLTDVLHAGLHIYNPVGGRLGKDKTEKLASVYKAGIGYDASPALCIGAEIIKEADKPVNVVAGLQYRFSRQFYLRAGVLAESTSVYAGAGVSWNKLRLDISTSYHPQLGVSPGILLLFNFKAVEK
jgi:hypothetical protein